MVVCYGAIPGHSDRTNARMLYSPLTDLVGVSKCVQASEKASLLPNLADGESKMSRTSSIRQLTGTIKAVRFDRGH